MIEAVNSTVASAQVARPQTEPDAVESAQITAAVASEAAASTPRAPYVSPYIYVDVNFNKAVLQLRDSDTGDVVQQFPSESTLEARRRADVYRANVQVSVKKSQAETSDSLPTVSKQTVGNISAPISSVSADSAAPQVVSTPAPSPGTTAGLNAQIASAALISSSQVGNAPDAGTVSVSA